MLCPRILIVDDSLTIRRIIKNTLKSLGYLDVIEAADGLEAMEKIKEGGIGLILIDWNMPKMGGLDFVKAIKEKSEYSSIPLIMVTTEVAKPDVVEALKQGVNDYIFKPFTSDVLKDKIRKIFEENNV